MTANLFPLYLMGFMFHTMLDAAGIVLRVHYQSMKCDVLFLQGCVRTLFRRGGNFSYMSTKNSSSLQQCKKYKNCSRFPKVMITNVLPPFFMVHSVLRSECRCATHQRKPCFSTVQNDQNRPTDPTTLHFMRSFCSDWLYELSLRTFASATNICNKYTEQHVHKQQYVCSLINNTQSNEPDNISYQSDDFAEVEPSQEITQHPLSHRTRNI